MGRKAAAEKLRGPGKPPELAYLLEWHGELEWGRQIKQWGLQGFTWRDVQAWADLTQRRPSRQETKALMMIDLAKRFPGDE